MNTKRIWLCLLLAAILLLSGCAMRTVDMMYRVPKRSEEYAQLQSAIDRAMAGLEYCAPTSGENQQTVQMADLNGDGISEYLLFAKGSTENPLHILIFRQVGEEYELMTTMESRGSAFEQVEYVDIDDQPGLEIVVGRRLSDQIQGAVSIYSFAEAEPRQLLSTGYSKFLTCDLDNDGRSELMVLGNGETDADNGIAVQYSFRAGSLERSAEVDLSEPADCIKRIMVSKLHGGTPAVYVASSADGSAIVTDIFAMKDGTFTNISFSNESGTSVQTLRNYYVYADDIDDDGILELPSLITMYQLSRVGSDEAQYLIRWFAMDPDGREVDKMYTFHNFQGGWYIQLNDDWASHVSVEQIENGYRFFIWNSAYTRSEEIASIYALTGTDRDEQALADERFTLYRAEGVVYAAKLTPEAEAYGITQDSMISAFHLIQRDWKTGET